MQSSQNGVGLFRVFKPTILFQAPPLPSIQQLLLKPELNGSHAALWNQSLGPLSYNVAPPPSGLSHVPSHMHSEGSYGSVFGQHTTNCVQPVQSNPYQANNITQLNYTDNKEHNNEDNTVNDTPTITPTTGNCKSRKKKYPCPLCDVRCSNNGQLQGHLRIHTGEKPYRCNHEGCTRRFARNEELTRHKRIHTGFRPHKCEICQKAFGRKDHLNKHKKTHLQDSEKKVFICTFRGCKQRYSRSDALKRHQCSAHSKQLSTRSRCAMKPEKQESI